MTTLTAPASAPGVSPRGAIAEIAADIKLHHSVFAMPFALLAAFMAANKASEALFWQLGLIVLAMVLARTAAMLANRLLDRAIDARNPRTAQRAVPSGRLSVRAASVAAFICVTAFMGVCATFGFLFENWWPLILGLPVLAWICAYPLFKRFTSLCHLWLGASLAISPLAAAIAVDPGSLPNQPSLWLLAAMVLCWVAGFDIIYALQDVEVDRREGLFSIPARLGVSRALWVSRALHAAAFACLLACLLTDQRLGTIFAIGVGLVGALLIVEHSVIAHPRKGKGAIIMAFFTINGFISCILGAMGIADVLAI